MRAFRLGDSLQLPGTVDEIARPLPAADEILVRVHAAGVTPTELQWYPTTHTKTGGLRTRAVPGHEFSGVVEQVGEAVQDLTVGQTVYGMSDWFTDGATAEYCISKPQWVAPKPASLTHAQAATVPIGALTAWQALFDRVRLKQGERVLIHGGSGAVGIYAMQLSHTAGAHVFASASAKNLAYLKELGADVVIDYAAQRFEDVVGKVDVVVDTVGGETLNRSWDVLAPGGRLVTIAASSEAADERTKKAFLLVEARRQELKRIGALIDAGTLRVTLDAVVPLGQASAAYAGKAESRMGRGKIVVAIVSDPQE